MHNKVFIYIIIGHKSFVTGMHCIVELFDDFLYVDIYKDIAFEKACAKLGINKDESIILDWKFLGENVTFVNGLKT